MLGKTQRLRAKPLQVAHFPGIRRDDENLKSHNSNRDSHENMDLKNIQNGGQNRDIELVRFNDIKKKQSQDDDDGDEDNKNNSQ